MGLKMLKRETDRIALARLEDAARTVDEFKNVTQQWDKLDENRERKERYWEKLRPEELLIWETSVETIIPPPIDHVWWRQLFRGDFLDTIHDCPHEIQELTSSRPVYDFTKELDENHKEILYYWAIRQWTPQKIAAMRGQSDRNIRKVYNKMIEDIRRKIDISEGRV